MTTDAMEWLEEVRGLDAELCARMGFKAGDHPKLGPGVKWEFRRDGAPYAMKFRPFGEKTFRWHPTDVKHGLFNLDALSNPELTEAPVVVTEGEFDAMACIQAGFPRSVSIPDGWSEKADTGDATALAPILEAEDAIRSAPRIIVAADDDGPGQAFARALAALFDDKAVCLAKWPEGCKDANDTLRNHGEAALAKALGQAAQMDPPGGIITGFSDLPPLPTRRIYRIGHEPFNSGLAFEQCAMSVCTGIPGSGKSTFVRWAANELNRNTGIRIGAVEFESGPHAMRDHLSRLRRGKPWNSMSKGEQEVLAEDLDSGWRVAHRAPSGDFTENMAWFRSRVHALAARDGCKFIYLDPWNELEHIPEPGESLTNYINWATKCIRQWAERYECHICVVAHPRKIIPDQKGGVRIPEGYDIADSAAWANKPALGFTVHQHDDPEDPHVKIRTWKVRNVQAYGFSRTTMKVDFDPDAMVYRRRMN